MTLNTNDNKNKMNKFVLKLFKLIVKTNGLDVKLWQVAFKAW